MSAIISPCGKYRYWLSREGDASKRPVAFIMLNPSTADASKDDATIRKCRTFAKGAPFVVVNLFAFRATKPADMLAADDPIGPDNERYIDWIAQGDYDIIFAHGVMTSPEMQSIARYTWLLIRNADPTRKMYCLGVTKDHYPRHPLYLANDTARVPFVHQCAL